jgi:hypothetical protein
MRAETWRRLAELAAISGPHEAGEPFHLSNRPLDANFDRGLGDRAAAIYVRLVAQARTQLN